MDKKVDIPIFCDADMTLIEGYQQFPLILEKMHLLQAMYPEIEITPENPRAWFKLADKIGEPDVSWITQLIRDARKGMPFEGLTKADLVRYGKKNKTAPGLKDGIEGLKREFSDYANLHFVIVSVGLKDMLRGFVEANGLAEHVEAIYAADVCEATDGVIDGICAAVSGFGKNERIIPHMKGHHSLLNKLMHRALYKFDYRDMIVVGDGFTDISMFAYAKKQGGIPACVYTPGSVAEFAKTEELGVIKWVDYMMPRDYSPNTITFELMKEMIEKKIRSRCATGFTPSMLFNYMKGTITDPDLKECVEKHFAKCNHCSTYFDKTIVRPDYVWERQKRSFTSWSRK